MNCQNNKDKIAKNVTLSFHREQLLYDIKNIGYIEGDTLGEEEQHSKHVIQDIGEEGNVDQVTRILDLIFDECVEILRPFTSREIEEVDMDNTFVETQVYSVALKLPEYSQTSVNLISRLIHEMMVAGVLAKWLGIANPKAAEKYAMEYEGLKGRLGSAVNMMQRARKPMHPF